MLMNARIEPVDVSIPQERLRGEENRAAFGDLLRFPPDRYAERTAIRQATDTAVALLADSEEAFLRMMEYPEDAIEMRLADPDDATSTIADAVRMKLSSRTREVAYEIFLTRFDSEDLAQANPGEPINARACYCLTSSCDDTWPLFEIDTWSVMDDYFCLDVHGRGERWEVEG